ncbi:hypothetical protein SAMN04490186_3974 [Pseudomonas grimontii]|uniref:Uncharacterized protein n=1 Tax=Pseudomonas grimontii TaxID=129847 RepID=A0ABY0TPF5_9PSED|nr:hypothetical protein SAMN04490186_3974 [Pseudomonas grimontii]
MNQPFEVTADGQVRIVGTVIRDNATFRWRAVISVGQNRRLLGFTYGHAQSVK